MKKLICLLFPFTLSAQSDFHLEFYLYNKYTNTAIDSSHLTCNFFENDAYIWSNTSLAILRLNKSGRIVDTLWFDYRTKKPDFIRFAFNPADLQANYTPKPRFAIGDSVTALLVRQPNQYWINGIVLAISPSNRYLLKFREIADYNERTKKFNYRNVRSWFDENDVEKFVDAKKFR